MKTTAPLEPTHFLRRMAGDIAVIASSRPER